MRILPVLPFILCLAGCEKAIDQVQRLLDPDSMASQSGTVVRLLGHQVDEFINRRNLVVVLDFYADWCSPCQDLAPKLESVAEEFDGKVIIGKVNVDRSKTAATNFGVTSIPDVRIYVNGIERDRFTGPLAESKIRARIAPLTYAVTGPDENTDHPSKDNPTGSPPPIQPMDDNWLPPGLERLSSVSNESQLLDSKHDR